MTHWHYTLGAILMLLGSLFCLLGAIGLLKMPDLYCRMQSTAKGQTLGILLIMLGVAISFSDAVPSSRAFAVVLFLFITAPVGGQMVSRAAYMLGVKPDETTKIDRLKDEFSTPSPAKTDEHAH